MAGRRHKIRLALNAFGGGPHGQARQHPADNAKREQPAQEQGKKGERGPAQRLLFCCEVLQKQKLAGAPGHGDAGGQRPVALAVRLEQPGLGRAEQGQGGGGLPLGLGEQRRFFPGFEPPPEDGHGEPVVGDPDHQRVLCFKPGKLPGVQRGAALDLLGKLAAELQKSGAAGLALLALGHAAGRKQRRRQHRAGEAGHEQPQPAAQGR